MKSRGENITEVIFTCFHVSCVLCFHVFSFYVLSCVLTLCHKGNQLHKKLWYELYTSPPGIPPMDKNGLMR